MLVSLEEKMSKSILCSQSIQFSILDRHISTTDFAAVEIDRFSRKRYRADLISASRISLGERGSFISDFCVTIRERHENIMLLVHIWRVPFYIEQQKKNRSEDSGFYSWVN